LESQTPRRRQQDLRGTELFQLRKLQHV